MDSSDFNESLILKLQLSDIEDGELAGDANGTSPNEIRNLLLQTDEYASGVLFKTELQQVSYGSYDGRPAAFIVFQSQFHYSGRNRIRAATIKVSLADAAQPVEPTCSPQVEKFAPQWRRARDTLICSEDSSSSGWPTMLQASSGPRLHRVTHSRPAEIKGYRAPHHHRRHPNVMNRVLWSVEEDDADRQGIPPFFRGAMVVITLDENSSIRPFLMSVQVDITQCFRGTVINFFRKSDNHMRPVRFAPDIHFRDAAILDSDFTVLNLEDWIGLPRPGLLDENDGGVSSFISLQNTRSASLYGGSLEDFQTSTRPRSRDDFEIAVICARPVEADAVLRVFDAHWDTDSYTYGRELNDPNSYSVGVLGGHNVVLAHQPGIGKATAASVAAACAISFKKIKLALVVGVCGGVPFNKHNGEILLGDVVISKGVIQYDFGRRFADHFKRKIAVEDSLGKPNARICSLLAKLETALYRESLEQKISEFLADSDFGGPVYPQDSDKLFSATYRHKHQDVGKCGICASCKQITDPVCEDALQSTCQQTGCDDAEQVRRQRQNQKNRPMLHIGLIASGDSVIKSGVHRDSIANDANVIAFEMEGAGVWDTFPCVIIKGVSDYSDSHKSKLWQKYAAATAAACTKAFIKHW